MLHLIYKLRISGSVEDIKDFLQTSQVSMTFYDP